MVTDTPALIAAALFATVGGYQIRGAWLDRWGKVFTALVLLTIGVLVLTGVL